MADSPSADLRAAVAAAFDHGGPLAQVLEDFEPRPSQRTMADAVVDALLEGHILLAEAGTGTGKTLAYLVPAILHGRRTLVSTGTKNLQEQIVQKDVPVLQRALGRPFSATCMKGRANYLCLHRFEAFRVDPAPRSRTEQRHLALIEAWAEHTDTGDRAEIDELPDDLPLWNEISATTDTCVGAECPRHSECFVTRMRQRAAEADLVIVNHHLLCADAAVRQHSFGEVIPECGFAIIDEAHQLEDVATQYFGVALSNYRVDQLAGDARRAGAPYAAREERQATGLAEAAARVEAHARRFFAALVQGLRNGEPRTPPAAGGLFDERRRLTAQDLEAVVEPGLALVGAFDAVEAAVGLMPDASEDLRSVARRAAEIRESLRFLVAAADPSFVYFLETRGKGVFLKAMPVDVSSIVRKVLFDRFEATVLTSATLAVDGRFAYVRARLGVTEAREVLLRSEFDYARQSILYLPRRMPDPRTPAFGPRAAEEILEILQRTEGRAFALFTSYATLREVQPVVEAALPYPLFVQGEAPRSVLLEQFRETPNAVLLATSSFWQGVDVIGEALSCVIVDKLPFASPGDPLVQARIDALARQGADPFAEYQVPLAILTLLQGLGRLLRHRRDRGVLAILDPRIRTMGYGRRFLASLPPSPITHDLDDISRFFRETSIA